MKAVTLEGRQIVVARVAQTLYAFDAICSHQLAYLEEGELAGHEVVCPLHGGSFDIRTGAARQRPARTPIKVYPVRTEGGTVLVGVE